MDEVKDVNLFFSDSIFCVDQICNDLSNKTSHSGIDGDYDFIRIEIWIQSVDDISAILYYSKEFNTDTN
jgi:hypothetical protein